jgi:hypothetical protein
MFGDKAPGSGLERGSGCHPERSEGSLCPSSQTLRGVDPEPIRFAQDKLREWAQGDRHSLQISAYHLAELLSVYEAESIRYKKKDMLTALFKVYAR